MKPGGTSLQSQLLGAQPGESPVQGLLGLQSETKSSLENLFQNKFCIRGLGGCLSGLNTCLACTSPYLQTFVLKKKYLKLIVIGRGGTQLENEMLYYILCKAKFFRKFWILCINMIAIQDSWTLSLSMKIQLVWRLV